MKQINSICIFGGGSAGWITALSISTTFPEFKVTMILPTQYSNIGVGESTQDNLISLIGTSGMDFADFVKKTDATIKHGIYYTDWNTIGEDYWHPFSNMTDQGFYTDSHKYHFLNQTDPGTYPRKNYYKTVHADYEVCVKQNTTTNAEIYGIHIDADKAADYIRNFLKDSITVVESADVEIFSDGNNVQHIRCGNQNITADLFVDCSGFSRKLIGTINGVVEDGYEGNVNTALFMRLPYVDKDKETIPYTQASATKYGWIWTIPLDSRLGTGCVYNDKFCSDTEAEQVFREYWGTERTKDMEIKKIKFHSGSLKNPWKGNVVAIGLSSGFVEPLEATGIAWFINSCNVLKYVLQHRYYDEDVANRFNANIRQFVEDVQDFVDVHYMLSARRDSEFWKYQTSRPRSSRVLARLETYKRYMPNKNNRVQAHGFWAFNDVSWIDILTGYDFTFDPIKL
jgi:tryptophan halogenase